MKKIKGKSKISYSLRMYLEGTRIAMRRGEKARWYYEKCMRYSKMAKKGKLHK